MSTSASASNASSRRPWLVRAARVLGAWLVLEILMLGLTVGWIALYSYAINPGHAASVYEDYAGRASPVVCLVISAPVFGAFAFLCGRRGGRTGSRFALKTTVVYLVIDAAICALAPYPPAEVWPVWSLGTVIKLVAVIVGGRLGARTTEARV